MNEPKKIYITNSDQGLYEIHKWDKISYVLIVENDYMRGPLKAPLSWSSSVPSPDSPVSDYAASSIALGIYIPS